MPRHPLIQKVVRIFKTSFPVTGAMLSQSFMGIVDTAIVGHLSTAALAAVGAGNFAMYFCLALIAGLGTAIQTQVSRNFGRYGAAHHTIQTSLLTGFIITVALVTPLMLILLLCAPNILMLVTPSSGAIDGENTYFIIRLLALPAAALSLSLRGFWNGTHQAGIFLKILLASHLFNAALSFVLVYGYLGFPLLGIKGAAIGSSVAMYTGCILNLIIFRRWKNTQKVRLLFPSLLQIKRSLRLAIPDSFQQTLFALGMLAFYGMLAQLGENAMAIGFIISNLTIFLILIGISFGIAGASLTGQAIGAGHVEEAFSWGWITSAVCFIVILICALPLLIFPSTLISIFSNDNTLLAQSGSLPLQVATISIIADSISLVLAQTLLSAGMAKQVLAVRVSTLWLLGLPLCLLSIHLDFGLAMLWAVQTIQRLCASACLAAYWCQRKWRKITF